MPSDIYSSASIDEEPLPLDAFLSEEGEVDDLPQPTPEISSDPNDGRLQLSQRLLALPPSRKLRRGSTCS